MGENGMMFLNNIFKLVKTDGFSLFGDYDLIAKIEEKDFEELGKIVLNKIRTMGETIDKNINWIKILREENEC